MLRSVVAIFAIVCFLAVPAYAKPKGQGAQEQKQSAGERIGNETADAVADVLTGEDSKKTSSVKTKKGTPPGLSKKGKVPPGWNKGKKTGWEKTEGEDSGTKSESPIRQIVRKMFGQKDE